MNRLRIIYSWLLLGFIAIITPSCIPEQPAITDQESNFEALWKIIDERYCFHEEKGVDWDKIGAQYRDSLRIKKPNHFEFFYLMVDMLNELKDGHVSLLSEFDNGYYKELNPDPTKGLNIYARSLTLGGLKHSGGMRYGLYRAVGSELLFGYISYGSFSNSIGNIPFIFALFEQADGIILDVRGNGGGSVENSNKLVSYFLKEKTLVGYTSHKTGPRRHDFSKPKPLYITPDEDASWTKKPLIILQDRSSYSATNDFLYKVNLADNAIRMGQVSGGGTGMPATSELPNGWRVRYSAVKSYDHEMKQYEAGLKPDIFVENESYLDNPGARDNILISAIIKLSELAGKPISTSSTNN